MGQWKALSIMQPVASLIAAGLIDVENRSWNTHFRGTFLIHAGNHVDLQAYEGLRRMGMPVPRPDQVLKGGIIGIATVRDCVRSFESHSVFANGGRWTFEIERRRVLPFVPCRGKLFFFDVEDQIIEELRKAGAKLPKNNQSQRNKQASA